MSQLLTTPIGNNTFSYAQRQSLGSDCTLVISDTIEIQSLDQVKLGDFVVFEEVDHHGQLQSCTGLAHTYILHPPLSRRGARAEVIITDNHNHVLPYWLQLYAHQGRAEITSLQHSPEIHLIHIDQHSDLGANQHTLDISQIGNPNYRHEFAHHHCNIGNFITPCIQSGLITHMTQIRTEYALRECASQRGNEVVGVRNNKSISHHQYSPTRQLESRPLTILDIDLDFRAPEMSISHKVQTMDQVRLLMNHADLITIATSPYFIDQTLALEVLHELVGPRLAKYEGNDTLG